MRTATGHGEFKAIHKVVIDLPSGGKEIVDVLACSQFQAAEIAYRENYDSQPDRTKYSGHSLMRDENLKVIKRGIN